MAKLSVNQILLTLENQLRYGKSYLSIARGLADAEPIVQGSAPTFFGLMSEAGFFMAQMCLARLFDEHNGTVTVPLLLDKAAKNTAVFKYADNAQVVEAVRASRAKVDKLGTVLAAITHRRNTWFAHIDPRAVNDPTTHQKKAELTVDQLQEAYVETESIIQKFDQLLNDVVGPISFLGGNDYVGLFELIRRSNGEEMRRFDQAFQAQFGHPPPKNLAETIE